MVQINLTLIVSFLLAFQASEGLECDSKESVCVDFRHYQQCSKIVECPDGTVCDHSSGTAACKTPTFKTAQSEETPINCSGPDRHPSSLSCYQYYECKHFIFWWIPELITCPEGLAFDVDTKTCAPLSATQCQSRPTTTTTTTTVSPIDEPECKQRGKHPALVCYQYIECVTVWFWYEPRLKTCPQGQAYDPSSQTCVCAGLVNCQLPVTELACDGPGRQPGLTCEEYYECTQMLWWWDPKLRKCPAGQVYDKSTCNCVSQSLVQCSQVPQCYGHWKYPAAEKNQYYECGLNETGDEWFADLKMCPDGLVFLSKFQDCAPEWLIIFT